MAAVASNQPLSQCNVHESRRARQRQLKPYCVIAGSRGLHRQRRRWLGALCASAIALVIAPPAWAGAAAFINVSGRLNLQLVPAAFAAPGSSLLVRMAGEGEGEQEEDDKAPQPRAPGDPLLCGKNTEVARLAGAIMTDIERNGFCSVQCLGSSAIYRAVKAIIVADTLYRKDPARSDKALAVFPRYVNVTVPDRPDPVSAMVFRTEPLPPLELSVGQGPPWERKRDEDGYPALRSQNSGDRAKLGALTGALKAAVQGSGAARLLCVGVQNVNMAIKSIVQLGQYLRQDLKRQGKEPGDGDGPFVAAFPSWFDPNITKAEDGSSIRAVRFTCGVVTPRA